MTALPSGGSALERLVGRLLAQRAHLEAAVPLVERVSGPVFEIGLGKGRTYSHLRSLFPDRPIYCFDRELHAPPGDQPPTDHLFLGEFRDTIAAAAARIGTAIAFAHCDIGTRRPERDLALARYLAATLPQLMAPSGVIAGDRPLESSSLVRLTSPSHELPRGIPQWPYFLYRAAWT